MTGRFSLAALLAAGAFTAHAAPLSQEQAEFVDHWQAQGLDRQYLESALAKATKQDKIIEAISSPWEAKPWYQYRGIFLKQGRLDAGIEFWREHRDTLEAAESEFGVEPEIVLAILGVESYYGRHMGTHSVLDSLYTLGFYYPPRQKFFRKQLGHFLQLADEQGWQAETIKSSYAGAMGYGQFIPTSYQNIAIDFDKDGKRDLLTNPVDAIGSVAAYFNGSRWQAGMPVVDEISLPADADLDSIKWNGKKLKQDTETLAKQGIEVPAGAKGPFAVLPLEVAENEMAHYLVHPNFYAITRYNHSPLYAMAVWQFSQQLKAAMDAESSNG